MTDLPNPAQLRAMARPAPKPRPCVPGRHCERRARDLGACIAGECNPPAPPRARTVTDKDRMDWLQDEHDRLDQVFGAMVRNECGSDLRAIIDERMGAGGVTPCDGGNTNG